MKKIYSYSFLLGFISSLPFFFGDLISYRIGDFIINLENLIFHISNYSNIGYWLYIITVILFLALIFFFAILILWNFGGFKNKHSFSFVLKVNLFFGIGTIASSLIFVVLTGVAVSQWRGPSL